MIILFFLSLLIYLLYCDGGKKIQLLIHISLSKNAVITRNKYSYNQRYGTFVPLCVSTGDIEYRYSYITGNYYELMYRKYHHLYLILLERTYRNGLFIIQVLQVFRYRQKYFFTKCFQKISYNSQGRLCIREEIYIYNNESIDRFSLSYAYSVSPWS